MTLVLVALGGAVGAVGRYLVEWWLGPRTAPRSVVPWATLVVNLLGSFGLGLLVGADVGRGAYVVLGSGVCGGFTTFSAYAVQTHRLVEVGDTRVGAAYGLLSPLACVASAAAGVAVLSVG